MLAEYARFLIAQNGMGIVEQIARNLPANVVVQRVFDFLTHHGCIIYPDKKGEFCPGRGLDNRYFEVDSSTAVWVYIFDPEDLKVLLPVCIDSMGLRDPSQRGLYQVLNRIIVILPCSVFMSAVYLLHEGFHAWIHQVRAPGVIYKPDEHEYEVQRAECKWLLEYGGDPFREALNRRKKFILDQLEGKSLRDYRRPKVAPLYPAELDTFMGPPSDTNDRRLRNFLVQVHAFYSLLEESDLSPAERIEIAELFSRT